MITSHIIGGLGNQMFQYAAGRSLALQNGCELQLDTSDFAAYTLHQGFELDIVFGINLRRLDKISSGKLLGWRKHRFLSSLFGRIEGFGTLHTTIAREPSFNYWPKWMHLQAPAYLFGYWQSERYFSEFKHEIRQDFRFRQNLDPESNRIAEAISNKTSVSLHVRRGDYAKNPKTTALHGLCSPAYYSKAIDYLAHRANNLHLFIFSDDIPWVKANLPIAGHNYTYVSHNKGSDSWRDMQLMSLCQHHIIANSSFSWWGAWLNPSPKKFVVAPEKWFAKDIDTSDLIPESWIRL